MKSILLVDDDYELGELLQEYLSMEGFSLTAVQDGETGLAKALSGEFDLIAKVYVPEEEDVGHFLSSRLFDIPGISRTLTTMTFKAF